VAGEGLRHRLVLAGQLLRVDHSHSL
jgi:hypothetical protein